MSLGTLLVVIALLLAIVSIFVVHRWLLAAAVIAGFAGVLVGASALVAG